MAQKRTWNLNENRPGGDFFKGGIEEGLIDLHLGFRTLAKPNAPEPVGRFRLDLRDLARRGFVKSEAADGSGPYGVQILRVDGRYYVGLNQGSKTPLEPFRVR
ncbi:MAG TPA: hypothetical protein PKA64_23970 [Myxococcota bacterium]|nr:hypothetical protein [Myxococcota bacterium]